MRQIWGLRPRPKLKVRYMREDMLHGHDAVMTLRIHVCIFMGAGYEFGDCIVLMISSIEADHSTAFLLMMKVKLAAFEMPA